MSESLKNKTISGVVWSFIEAILGQGVTFLVGIVLARLLTPSEYGLIGIVLIFVVVLGGMVDGGFSTAIIRKKNTNDEDYSTMFFTNMFVSIFLFVLLYFAAPYISFFFKRPDLTSITRVMGMILILQALSITQVTILTKRVDFKTRTKASVISAFISGVVGIVMAYEGMGVWSLVGQQLTSKLVNSICLWIFIHWRPRLTFNIDSFKYMWGFGWKIMLSGILNNTWNQLYQVVIGKCYTPATLGQYTKSMEYASLCSSNLTAVIQRVTYPVLSEIQDNPTRMIEAYKKVVKVSMFITAISMLFLGAISQPLIFCLIGPQWEEAATYLPIVCVSMSLYPLHVINLNILQIQGRSDIYLLIEIIKKIIGVLPLLMGVFINIYWMLIGSVFTGIVGFVLNSSYAGRAYNYGPKEQSKDVSHSYLIALVIGVCVYFLKYLPINIYLILLLQIVLGGALFFIVCSLLSVPEYAELKGILVGLTQKLRFQSLIKRNNE